MSDTVQEIGKIVLKGNTIPNSWFKHIKLKSGKADTNAIILLSEIVFYYRPTRKKDKETGRVILEKKFAADKWQASYHSLAKKFGLTKRQVADALKRLKRAGLITIEFRVVATKAGRKMPNVAFIEPVPEAIKAITYDDQCDGGITLERNISYVQTEDITYISTENKKNNIYSSSCYEQETETPLRGDAPMKDDAQTLSLLNEYFDRYWKAEPRKVDKDRARRVWVSKFKKYKEFPLDNFNAYMNMRLAEAEKKRAENGDLRYLKHPATWINATDFSSPPSIEELEALGLVEETIRWERADDGDA